MQDKNLLRKEMLNKRNALSQKDIKYKSDIIIDNLMKTNEFKTSKTIFTYISMGSEISTYELIEKAWQENKQIASPIVIGKEMRFVYIQNFDNLKRSSFGVLEPTTNNFATPDNDSLIIVPGLIFDKDKNRIGYGGGYYDRYLSQNTAMATIAVCYAMQVIDKLEAEKYDIPVDKIITEEFCI